MARIKFSPLIVEASGSVKDTVFSRWKGRAYIRARVTPSNPNTAAQQLVRNSLKACVKLYQSLEQQIMTALDLYSSPYGYSGYNAFMKANRAAEQASTELWITLINRDIIAISDLSAATGSGSGEINLTWTDPGQGAGYYIYVAVRKTGEDVFTVEDNDVTLASAGAFTITGLTPNTLYEIFVAVEVTADHKFSESDYDTATSLT